MFSRRDEVGKCVRLGGKFAFAIPAPALVGAAAHMGDRIDEAAVDERQAVGVERGGDGDAVGAVAIDEAGRGPVERRVLAEQDRDRHGLAVGGRREQPPRHIVGWIVSARHFPPLAQDSRALRQVIVPHFGRRRHRRIAEAQRVGRKLVAVLDAERIGFLVEGDRVLLAAGEMPHDDARQTVGAFQPDQPVGEHHMGENEYSRAMRDEVAPMRAARVRQRRDNELEVLGAVGVGEQNQRRFAREGGMMLDFVAQRRLARGDQRRLRRRVPRGRSARLPRSRDRAPRFRRSGPTAAARVKRKSRRPPCGRRAHPRSRARRAGAGAPRSDDAAHRGGRSRRPAKSCVHTT